MIHTQGIHRVRRKQRPCERENHLVTTVRLACTPPRREVRVQTQSRCMQRTNEWRSGRIGTVHASCVHLLVALPHSPLPASRERLRWLTHHGSARHRRLGLDEVCSAQGRRVEGYARPVTIRRTRPTHQRPLNAERVPQPSQLNRILEGERAARFCRRRIGSQDTPCVHQLTPAAGGVPDCSTSEHSFDVYNVTPPQRGS